MPHTVAMGKKIHVFLDLTVLLCVEEKKAFVQEGGFSMLSFITEWMDLNVSSGRKLEFCIFCWPVILNLPYQGLQ